MIGDAQGMRLEHNFGNFVNDDSSLDGKEREENKHILDEAFDGCVALVAGKKQDLALAGLLSQEPWPDDVQLFQPYETEQILLPDNANCLAVQTFLKMCDLKYVVEYRTNAEEMSPSGRVPFIKCGAYLVSDFEPITAFVANKGKSLSAHLDEVQKADMRAFMSLVNTVLGNAENYITWVDDDTYSKITKPRYGSIHPFPLNHLLCYLKRKNVTDKLNALRWANKTLEKVYEEVDKGCNALSDRLEKSKFFFGDQPTELDALVFGHIYTILATPLPNNRLASTIRGYPNLIDHCKIIEKQLFDCYALRNINDSFLDEILVQFINDYKSSDLATVLLSFDAALLSALLDHFSS